MIRDLADVRLPRIAWQIVNKVSRRKSTGRVKLKAASLGMSKQHFQNLLGKPPKVTDEPIAKIISNQLVNKQIISNQTRTLYARRT